MVSARFDGKVAVVTGASSGIGEGIARRVSGEGAQCVLADVREDRGRAVAESLGPAARFLKADVSDEADVAGMVDYAVAEFGRLDCLFNNAGVLA